MSLKDKIAILRQVNLSRLIYYNVFCPQVERTGKGKLIPFRHSVIRLAKGAKIRLGDGNLEINTALPRRSHAEAYLLLDSGAVLETEGTTQLCYGSTLELHEKAHVKIGSAYINSGSVVLAALSITMGKEVLISRDCCVYDADHHVMYDENGNEANPPKPVTIGDHVWLGLHSIVLRGCRIGDGAVLSAGSVAGGRIKSGTMASGNPARSYWNVNWNGNLRTKEQAAGTDTPQAGGEQ